MLKTVLAKIKPLDTAAMEKCQLRLDNLTKPLGSLHALEHLAVKLAGVTGCPRPRELDKSLMVLNLEAASPEQAAVIQVLAEHVGAKIVSVRLNTPAKEVPELTEEQVLTVLNAGIQATQTELASGVNVIGIGAIGADDGELTVSVHSMLNTEDPIQWLMAMGDYTIIYLTGVILAAAAGRAVVVLDGVKTVLAAQAATCFSPFVTEYLMGSHFSAENGFKSLLDSIGIPAYLHLNMKTGDGTGAALGISLLMAALHVLNDMKTFGEAQVAVAQDGPGALKQKQNII